MIHAVVISLPFDNNAVRNQVTAIFNARRSLSALVCLRVNSKIWPDLVTNVLI